jgi:hypothetical protein
MANFTPLKNIDRKKINKFFLIANFLLIFLISIVVLIYYNQILKPTKPGAAQRRCRDIDNQRECNASCSPLKSNGKSYACKWLSAQNKCIESGNECGGSTGGGGEEITAGFCSKNQPSPTWVQCGSGIGDSKCTFCLKPYKRTCNQILQERGCGKYISSEKCTRINSKCFRCTSDSGGLAYHYKCDRVDLSGGCQENGRLLGNFGVGTHEFCFDGNPNDCGFEQIDWGNDRSTMKILERIGPVSCGGGSTNQTIPSIPTNTPTPTPTRIIVSNTPTPTPTIIISDTQTPTPTDTPIPTNTPTTPPNQPTNTPGPTATETPSPSPTEIILVANNNTPTSSPITNTPIQEIVQAGDRRSFLILSIPISLIILSLFL